jgi:hypothetical protein
MTVTHQDFYNYFQDIATYNKMIANPGGTNKRFARMDLEEIQGNTAADFDNREKFALIVQNFDGTVVWKQGQTNEDYKKTVILILKQYNQETDGFEMRNILMDDASKVVKQIIGKIQKDYLEQNTIVRMINPQFNYYKVGPLLGGSIGYALALEFGNTADSEITYKEEEWI